MMTPAAWSALRHFKPEEFDSKDKPGSAVTGMQYEFMRALDRLRERVGGQFVINSGFRTPKHNKAVGGRKNSAHLRGWAADISLPELAKDLGVTIPAARDRLIETARLEKFARFGLYRTFVHLDMDPSLPQDVTWLEGE